MTIRPVDFQGLVPKIQRLSQENQQMNNKTKVQHQQFAHEDKKMIEHKLNKINKFESKGHPTIKNDEGNKKGKNSNKDPYKKKRNYKKDNHDSNEQKKNLENYAKLDIRI